MFQFRRRQRGDGADKADPAGAQANTLDAKIEAIRERFVARARDDYTILSRYRQSRAPGTPELVSVVHRLAGSAGMVGYSEIGAAAGRLDDELAEPGTDTSVALLDLLAVMEKTLSPERSN